MRIGIDLGGTKIEGLALLDDGAEAVRRRVPTPQGDYDATVRAVADLVGQIEAEVGGTGTVGVGIPGALEAGTGRVKNANSTWIIGRPLDRDLSGAVGREVRVSNDANCFALSEASDGAGAGAAVVFGVILGTGVGGGLVVDGRVVEGASRAAGEWGHVPLPWPTDAERPGPDCYCGKRGCVETFLSGPALARDHERHTGHALRPKEVAQRAEAGDADAVATLDRYVDRLARGLGVIATLFDPDVVVLGGGLSNLPRLAERVEPEIERWAFSDRIETRVRRNVHGDSGGVRGAAWLWPAGG